MLVAVAVDDVSGTRELFIELSDYKNLIHNLRPSAVAVVPEFLVIFSFVSVIFFSLWYNIQIRNGSKNSLFA